MVIPKESAGHVKRWEIASFDQPLNTPDATPSTPPEVPPPSEEAPRYPTPSNEEIEQLRENARQQGFEQGFSQGISEGNAEARTLLDSEIGKIKELTANFQSALLTMDQTVAEQLLELSLEVARQVILGSIPARKEPLLSVIQSAIETLPLHHGHIILSVSPEDVNFIKKQLGEQFAQTGGQILEDPTIRAGGCTLRAGTTEIDATLETRWKRVLEAIGQNPQEWQI